ncbi:MAG: methylmalonyl-CoA mutase, partial [Gemmatimonadetes bacterium]|nr:methylmalonyl-CoA mutase [Gemmatimonadota bacterium]NIW36473.1 methylmalonyl-CoA mutase [Gemmatimonadota bacterium]NIX43145.1 methylmalonyl-CoA mutase [Gemmatimonadota bacterium]NIY07308.1 methylmalonyl-CoA mutase [Gemmatimonadota bacterium]
DSGERIVVGVNEFTGGNEDSDIEILKIGDEAAAAQEERLARLKADRDDARVEETLERLREAARSDENVVEPMLDCVRAYCTLFEIRHALESVYGSFKEPVFF